jgi:transcriptional regulator GlxA family with amidase domain
MHAFTVDRNPLERSTLLYLDDCYRRRTVARVSELAEFIGITPQHLSRTVRRVCGRHAREFLHSLQLKHASRLLSATRLSVKEIATLSAFGDESTFHRRFVPAFGTTPSMYRQFVTRNREWRSAPLLPRHPERRLPFC